MCNDLDFFFKPIVLVTGFGPFIGHPENASWEAVKLMNKEALEKKHNIELVQLEIPVTYENVDEFVPAIWDTHEPKELLEELRQKSFPQFELPSFQISSKLVQQFKCEKLMIHVGVSGIATQMTLEMQAHRKGYQRLDYFDKCPMNNVCTADGAIRLHTKLDVERICQEYNDSSPEENTVAVSSKDAGRYLCEYIYYTSLSVDNTRTLFVHVPDMNVYSSEQVARGLERILDLCLRQIKENEAEKEVTDKMGRTSINGNTITSADHDSAE